MTVLDPADGPTQAQRRTGLHVLVVENEPVIALDVAELLNRSAYIVLGPYSNVIDALTAINNAERIDGAILDINLGSEHSLTLADALLAKSVPYVWVSGFGPDILPARHRDRPFVAKPFTADQLTDALDKAIAETPPAPQR